MLKKIYSSVIIAALAIILGTGATAFAMAPTSTATYSGSGNSVGLSVVGDPNATVYLNYTNSSMSAQSTAIGTTDSNGNFSTTVTGSTYNIMAGSAYNVTVNGTQSAIASWPMATGTSNGTLSFSPTNSTVSYGQTVPITISGGTGNYFISSNSNPSAVSASINGSTLSVYGANNTGGASNITVCSTNATNCSTFAVTASGNGTTNTSAISLGQTAITLTPGQAYTIPITGNGSYVVSGNTNSGIASASISGNSLIGTAVANGTTNISVCQNGTTCTPLAITVASTTPTQNTSTIWMTQNIMAGQTMTMTLSGGTAPYAVTSPTNTAVSSSLSGNTLTLSGLAAGQSSINICGANNTNCITMGINVVASNTTTPPATGTGSITTTLRNGSTGNEVMILQQKLTATGFYSGAIDGNFGPMTQDAVMKFQTTKGLTADGVVGPMTRTSMNA